MAEPLSEFSHIVALFLSEILRSRRTSIRRAADISVRLTEGLSEIHSEPEALSLLTSMEKDFEELTALKQVLHFGYRESDVKVYEKEIKEYAAHLSQRDLAGSARFLQEAAQGGCTIQHLCVKYPNFCEFVLNTEKRPLVENVVPSRG